jgi:hypothetical protein
MARLRRAVEVCATFALQSEDITAQSWFTDDSSWPLTSDVVRITNLKLECVHAPAAGLLVEQDGVALIESAALAVLPAEADAYDAKILTGDLSLESASDVKCTDRISRPEWTFACEEC